MGMRDFLKLGVMRIYIGIVEEQMEATNCSGYMVA